MLWTNEDYRKQLSEEHLKEKWYAEAGSKEEFSIYGEKIMEDKEEMVTIQKSVYDALCKASDWLDCLEAAGVDNWEGYDYACELREQNYPYVDDK